MKVATYIVSTERHHSLCRRWSSQFVLLSFLFLVLTCSVYGQATRSIGGPTEEENSGIEEMRARGEIKFAEKERLENLDRAREAAQLGSELYVTYTRINSFTPTEKKKLDRLEKVTRKIRSRAGGSDGDVTITDLSNQVGQMLKRLAETADEMRKAVEKTPRQIVSAAVIERSNEVLELIRYVRPFIQ
jgi:hypothetical protein